MLFGLQKYFAFKQGVLTSNGLEACAFVQTGVRSEVLSPNQTLSRTKQACALTWARRLTSRFTSSLAEVRSTLSALVDLCVWSFVLGDPKDAENFGIDEKYHDKSHESDGKPKHGFVCLPTLLHPKSIGPLLRLSVLGHSAFLGNTGTITLRSSDPFDSPAIQPNYLADPSDVKSLVEGLKVRAVAQLLCTCLTEILCCSCRARSPNRKRCQAS